MSLPDEPSDASRVATPPGASSAHHDAPFVFPPGFLFGTATAATQVEGHCDQTDWAAFAREPGRVRGGDTPAVACEIGRASCRERV